MRSNAPFFGFCFVFYTGTSETRTKVRTNWKTHDKIVERRPRTDPNSTAEHIDASSATADPSVLDPSDLPVWCIILPGPLLHLPHIRRIHHGPQITIMSNSPCVYCRSCARVMWLCAVG